jgi:hypothetical protein
VIRVFLEAYVEQRGATLQQTIRLAIAAQCLRLLYQQECLLRRHPRSCRPRMHGRLEHNAVGPPQPLAWHRSRLRRDREPCTLARIRQRPDLRFQQGLTTV